MKDVGLIRNVLNLGQLVEMRFWLPGKEHIESHGINWQTIVFIAGMMIMVEGLAKVGFFRWMYLLVAKLVHYKVIPILIAFMLLSGFLSMFIDSITVMLFLATVTVEIARLLKFDPVPIIIAEIFASNTGGSATMSGDPPNIIIGTSLGYTFMDFVANTGLIAWAGMLLAVVFFYFAFRKTLTASQQNSAGASATTYPEPREAIADTSLFLVHTGIFILVIILLVTHAQTGISVALIGVIAAVLTLLAATKDAFHVFKKTDWRTLLFFIGLFICVGGLEETGVLQLLADYIGKISGGSLMAVMAIILWVSAFASAMVDNIPFAATMVPVISRLG
jgi:Na+/H+ antiporter NhaD/arsenite permease-like protein